MKTYKITATISVSGVNNDDDAVSTLERMLSAWEEVKRVTAYPKSNIDITIRTIKESN